MRNFNNQATNIKNRVSFKSEYHQEIRKSNINEIGKGLDIQATAEQQKNMVVKFEGNKLVVRKTNQEDITQDKFFTMSKHGITTYCDNKPTDFIKIEDWLEERALFRKIRGLQFFSTFRTWKVLRMWRNNLVQANRALIAKNLSKKLFFADDIFRPIIQEHKNNCLDLEQLRVIDLSQQNRDSYTIKSFQAWHYVVQDRVSKEVKKASETSKFLFMQGIKAKIDTLKQKIDKQQNADEDDEIKGNAQQLQKYKNKFQQGADISLQTQIEKMNINHNDANSENYEKLGFKSNIGFGAKSELRDLCKRILRFAFLLDFVA